MRLRPPNNAGRTIDAAPAATSCRARFGSAALLASLAFLSGCGGAGDEEAAPRRPPLVEAVAAREGTLPLAETVNGTVRARDQVTVRPEIAGRVVEVLVRSGDAVERGQPLVRLDDDQLRSELRQAEADVRVAEAAAAEARARVAELAARIERTRALARDELVSAQTLDTQEAQLLALEAGAGQAEARVEQAAATADERRSALSKTVVRSPVAGRVGQRRAEVGMRLDPGTVLFVVGNPDQAMVEVPLAEAMLDHVEEGMPVIIEPRGAGRQPIRAALTRISPFLAEESFTTVGEIDVDNRDGRLRPGMFVTVRILYGESRRATLVPASAVWEDPESGRAGVFVVVAAAGLGAPGEAAAAAADEPREVVFRPVEVLASGGGTVGVGGVGEGDWVVVVGQHLLARDVAAGDAAPGAEAGPATAVARVRPTTWERIEELQGLQREDLLAGFLDKQRRIAAALGAEIPASEAVVERVLRGGETTAGAGGD